MVEDVASSILQEGEDGRLSTGKTPVDFNLVIDGEGAVGHAHFVVYVGALAGVGGGCLSSELIAGEREHRETRLAVALQQSLDSRVVHVLQGSGGRHVHDDRRLRPVLRKGHQLAVHEGLHVVEGLRL